MFTKDEINAVNDLLTESVTFMQSGDLATAGPARRFYILAFALAKVMARIIEVEGTAPVTTVTPSDDTDAVKADVVALETESPPVITDPITPSVTAPVTVSDTPTAVDTGEPPVIVSPPTSTTVDVPASPLANFIA
jgi:hypothetical protein